MTDLAAWWSSSAPAGGGRVKAMTIEEDSTSIVVVSGELDVGSAPTLLRYLLDLMTAPIDTITLDLNELSFIDSSGLKALIAARADAETVGITLTLRDVAAQPRRVLELTGLDELFDLDVRTPSREDAGSS
ncbi:MAG TPA: STAS domain-containing protein [Acidimicrobiia bacterium]